ncbi:hypothetical protein K503DRAFT_696301 [Rhizopogon vinicolor AM-OR11-026]|uniref:Uncharacterized protein n=1 Tax=Rhizopogon vinicolor AM-OR11-026 TaxID=1314800 RepID=A0A1B7MT86_9AGAM|nr:hypothetical protein K503DRAFT_696301 [Rhizopogon vinicolor AM-OR11-026]
MSGYTTPSDTTLSPRSPRFRDSVHHIPTPGTKVHRPKRYEPLVLNIYVVGGTALLMICLGIALEVALRLSNERNGFSVPEKNVFSFLSTQFITSFVPTLLVVPLSFFWAVADWMLRWYQPYVTLSEGKAPAARSILLDYVSNVIRLTTLYYSFKHRHWLINISTLTALSVIFLQPLAGSVFEILQVSHTTAANATSIRTVGLSATISQLNTFLASAGYADAAVYNNLQDPPFIHGGWSVAQFTAPPGSILNGTLGVNTTGIQTFVNCTKPTSFQTTTLSSSNVELQANFSAGCNGSLSLNPGNGPDQFSVEAASTCAPSNQDLDFQPVFFWFYHLTESGDSQGTAVFCQPSIAIFVVETTMDLNDGSLGNCTIVDTFNSTNNVTGNPLNGEAYNGVIFDSSNNTYISARALAIGSAVPGAIYQYASDQTGGIESTFDDPDGFVDATTKIYTQHLSVAAQNIYFLPANETIAAQLTSNVSRLFIDPLLAHLLSVLFICVGITCLIVHILHQRTRRNLWLTSPPGSIAAIVSLTSRSGFGELLLPYDDEARMKSNLAGLTFRLDKRTGAILAEEDFDMMDAADNTTLLGHKKSYSLSPLSRISFKENVES